MADMISVHQVTNVFERVGRTARDQLLHRDQLRDFQVDAGGAVFGNGADDVAFGEHADRSVAFGPDDILDYERADVAGPHKLGGNADGFIHANRRYAGCFLSQDVSDLHGNLPQVSRRTSWPSRLVYNMPTVNVVPQRRGE